MNGISVTVHSANVGECIWHLLDFYVRIEGVRTSACVIVNWHGYLERRPTTTILGLEVAKQIDESFPNEIK